MRMLRQGSVALLGGLLVASAAWAAPPERPTLNHTEDPRPNILPDWIYNHNVPYRLRYNRPRYLGGKIAYHIAPSSQEAMAWAENMDRGFYDGIHHPPLVKRYCYPKPWEALNTGPRPNTLGLAAGGQPGCCPPGAASGAPEAIAPVPANGDEGSEPIEGGRSELPGANVPEPEVGASTLKNVLRPKPSTNASPKLTASSRLPTHSAVKR